jgi:hypothetical protein
VVDVEGGNAVLFVAPSGESVLIDSGNGGAGAARDADRIAAAAKSAGVTRIDHLIVGAIGEPDENALAGPALSPDGRRVAASRIVQSNFDLWLFDVSRGVASRFTFDPSFEFQPIWSPDGT